MQGYIVLESGEVFPGRWLGGQPKAGEVVFNTSHSGYEEIATDPSYYSQIMVMTAPMQGNYGVAADVWESDRIWIQGFACVQMQKSVADYSWLALLQKNDVPTIDEIDTRELVLCLRSKGTPWGALVQANTEDEARQIAKLLIEKEKTKDEDWVYQVSRKSEETRKGLLVGPRCVVLDYGVKENILRKLTEQCSEVIILNSRASLDQVMSHQPDFVMLTNGPGDPSRVVDAVTTVKELIGKVPLIGICMGHQILALALGAKTYKLKFGHRGSNHPIRDSFNNRVYVSAQNHGYAVDEKSLPQGISVSHVNINDNTVAGLFDANKKFLSVQFHPESCPGPHDAGVIFEQFIQRIVYGNH